MSEATERWLEQARASIDEQLAELAEKDEAAWQVFRAKLFEPLD